MGSYQFWQTPKAGNLHRLSLQQGQLAPLSSDQITIDVKAVGINFADIFALAGLYSATPKGAFVPGLEFSGVVRQTGNSTQPFKVGDAVMGVTRFGGYSTQLQCSPDYLMPLPPRWSFAEGAAWPVQTLTAWYALRHLGAVQPGQRVLVQSAAGGVGLQAMKLCQALGASPTGTVSRQQKADWLAHQGFPDIFVREGDTRRQLAAMPPFDLVLDAVGGEVQKASFEALAPMGRLIVFGAAEFTPTGKRPDYLRAAWRFLRRPRYDVMDMISSNRSVMAFNLIWLWDQQARLQALLQELARVSISPPHVGNTLPFANAPDALRLLQSGDTVGKVVLLT